MPQINFMVFDPNEFYQNHLPFPDGLLIAVAVETQLDVTASDIDTLKKKAQEAVDYYTKPYQPPPRTISLGGQAKYQIQAPAYVPKGLPPELPNLGVISRWVNGAYPQSFVVDY